MCSKFEAMKEQIKIRLNYKEEEEEVKSDCKINIVGEQTDNIKKTEQCKPINSFEYNQQPSTHNPDIAEIKSATTTLHRRHNEPTSPIKDRQEDSNNTDLCEQKFNNINTSSNVQENENLFYDQQYLTSNLAVITSVEMVSPSFTNCLDNKEFTHIVGPTKSTMSSTENLTNNEETNGCVISLAIDPSVTSSVTITTATTVDIKNNSTFSERVDGQQTISSRNNSSCEGNIWAPHSDYKHENVSISYEKDNSNTARQNEHEECKERKIERKEHILCLQTASKEYTQKSLQATKEEQIQIIDSYSIQQQQQLSNRKGYVQIPHIHQQSYPHPLLQQEQSDIFSQYAHYTQQHYSHEQLFGLHHQQPIHHQLQSPHSVMQHMSLQTHMHQTSLQHLQPHQQVQTVDAYQDVLVDEFHEDRNSAFKLGLSPNNVKHENQDDGYETSAGDVLTPNSHSSSTHSVTPQHQLQHGVGPQLKTEEHQHQSQGSSTKHHLPDGGYHSQLQTTNSKLTQNINTDLCSDVPNLSNDPYNFLDDDIHLISPTTGRNISNSSSYVGASAADAENTDNFGMKLFRYQQPIHNQGNHQQLQQQSNSAQNLNTQSILLPSSDIDQKLLENDFNSKPPQKKRGRKKKNFFSANVQSTSISTNNARESNDGVKAVINLGLLKAKERKKHDRFNGMSEEDVIKRTLPDHLNENLDIVIIGINPGLFAAYKGHHYAGPGNHFWKCLYLSGLTQEQMTADEDYKLVKHGIGFTNMVQRATKGSADLTRKEIKDGSRILLEKLQKFRPKIAVFNGKLIFEVFSGKKDFNFGKQPECVEGTDTYIWVMPSSSARCAQLPRAADKVPFYTALKKFRDFLKGLIPQINESECVFTEQRIKQCCEQENFTKSNSLQHVEQSGGLSFDNNLNKPHLSSTSPNPNDISGTSDSFMYEKNENIVASTNHVSGSVQSGNNNFSNSYSMDLPVQEKKKRGRPKKIKGEELFDASGNKIQFISQPQSQHEFNNILNLSLMTTNGETPKKKRGRPKKIKPPIDMVVQTKPNHLLQQQLSTMPIQALSTDSMVSTQNQQAQQNLYNTPPPSHRLYTSSVSPKSSPALNCAYQRNTSPILTQISSPINNTHAAITSSTPTDELTLKHHTQPHISDTGESHNGETPPPSSPNICTVDFEPPTNNNENANRQNQAVQDQQLQAQQRIHSSHYESPAHETVSEQQSHRHYQQWLSPQHQQHIQSPVSQYSQQQQSLQYQDLSQHQEQQWQTHQPRYENSSSSPFLLSPHQHNQQQSIQSDQHSQHNTNDVARKSLSGLESLVDQIPTIPDCNIISISSSTVTQAVENSLQSLQVQHNTVCPQSTSSNSVEVHRDNFESSVTSSNNILSNSFSVSNLAASASTGTTNDNINNSNNIYSQSIEHSAVRSSAYHHTNLISAALAAAAANSSSSTSHHVTHSQVYMDPHMAHMAHVPVNPIYAPGGPPHPHHPAHSHHHPAYGPTAVQQGLTSTEYSSYGLPNDGQSSTLHIPSPNYPYGYNPTTGAPTNYAGYAHHHPHHGHHPSHHHISMFERIKPSDIGSYSGF